MNDEACLLYASTKTSRYLYPRSLSADRSRAKTINKVVHHVA